jgi:hypothetical protein
MHVAWRATREWADAVGCSGSSKGSGSGRGVRQVAKRRQGEPRHRQERGPGAGGGRQAHRQRQDRGQPAPEAGMARRPDAAAATGGGAGARCAMVHEPAGSKLAACHAAGTARRTPREADAAGRRCRPGQQDGQQQDRAALPDANALSVHGLLGGRTQPAGGRLLTPAQVCGHAAGSGRRGTRYHWITGRPATNSYSHTGPNARGAAASRSAVRRAAAEATGSLFL